MPGLAEVAAALVLAVAAGGAAAPVDSGQFRVITLRHAQTKFSIRPPEGFKLNLRNGVYVMRKRSVTVSYVRLDTRVSPAQLGVALVQALPGRVLVRAGDNRHFVAAVAGGSRNDHFVVERAGSRLAVTASTTPGVPVALETLRQMGLSARGGVMLRAPRPRPQQTIPLRAYRAPDGGATALVPSGNDWNIQSSGGSIQGSGRRGAFLFGFSYNVPLSCTAELAPELHHRSVLERGAGARAALPAPGTQRPEHPCPACAQGRDPAKFHVVGNAPVRLPPEREAVDGCRHGGHGSPVEVQQLSLELLLQRHRRAAGSSPAVVSGCCAPGAAGTRAGRSPHARARRSR